MCPPLDVALERGQLISPQAADLIHPSTEQFEALRLQAVQPHAGVVLRLLVGNESAGLEDTQMTTESGRGHRERLRQLAGAVGAPSQEIDDGTSCRLSECREGGIHVAFLHAGLRKRCENHQRWPSGSSAP